MEEVFVIFGGGIENKFFAAATVCGVVRLLLPDHDGPDDEHDHGAATVQLHRVSLAVVGSALHAHSSRTGLTNVFGNYMYALVLSLHPRVRAEAQQPYL